ncbi:MAG: hypothetical protein EP349_05875 [Alphaproteobacteria bacterium]|nr:MAG: hypothetical protein EP349_05875 [Alphaproteobacteria bacterium]
MSNGEKNLGRVTQEVVTDPGVGFGVRNALLFAANANAVGLGATLIAASIATITKTLSVMQPEFLKKRPNLDRITRDSRTPLQAIALSLLVVGVTSLAMGAFLPAATSLLFAVANFNSAESIAARMRAEKFPDKKTDHGKGFKKFMNLTFKRPDLYINVGTALSGLMAGGAAWIAFPAIALAFGISMYNAMNNKQECNGHPKIISAMATTVFAGIGFATGNFLPAISHLIGAGVLVNIESRVTPGGIRQVLKDIGNGIKSAVTPKKQALPSATIPAPKMSQDKTTVPSAGKLSQEFSAAPKPANQKTTSKMGPKRNQRPQRK